MIIQINFSIFTEHVPFLGCRSAALNLEARSLSTWNTQRHCVVSRLEHLTSYSVLNIKESAGGLLIVLPGGMDSIAPSLKEVRKRCFASGPNLKSLISFYVFCIFCLFRS